MENQATPFNGKIPGIIGIILGMGAATWSIIPILGNGAIWLALPGLISSITGFILAKKSNHPKKRMITGIVINFLALCLAVYWYTQNIKIQDADATQLIDSLNIH